MGREHDEMMMHERAESGYANWGKGLVGRKSEVGDGRWTPISC